jgi:hypothetical protein
MHSNPIFTQNLKSIYAYTSAASVEFLISDLDQSGEMYVAMNFVENEKLLQSV